MMTNHEPVEDEPRRYIHINRPRPQEWFCFARRRGHRNWQLIYRGRGKKRAYAEMAKSVEGPYHRAAVTFVQDYYGHTQVAEAISGRIPKR